MSASWLRARHEWRVISRERLPAAIAAVMWLAAAYAVANGHRAVVEQRERLAAVAVEEQGRLVALKADADAMEQRGQTPPRFRNPAKAAWVGEFLANRYAIWPAPPLMAWAIGQRDLLPAYFRISTLARETFIFDDEIDNPLALTLGPFDLLFVLVFLAPLLAIACTYDLVSGEREAGTLSLLRTSRFSLSSVVTIKAFVRGAWCLLVLAIPLTVDRYFWHASELGEVSHASVGVWLAALAAYVGIWLALCAVVNAVVRLPVSCGVWLLGLWIALTVVVPSLLGAAALARYPAPNRMVIQEAVRTLKRDLAPKQAQLLEAYYHEHPAQRPAGPDKTDWAPGFYALQREIDKTVVPLHRESDQQVIRQQQFVDHWRLLSPALVLHGALSGLAGTGVDAYRRFVAQTDAFHRAWQAYFLPRTFARTAIRAADYESLPAFVFVPSPADEQLSIARRRIGVVALTAAAMWLVAIWLMRRTPFGG